MAVTPIVTVAELASAVRVDANDSDFSSILTRLAGVGSELAELYAPDAPPSIRQEAVIRVSAYLFDQPESPPGTRYAAAWRNSGAAALVAPWVGRRAVAVTDDADV